MDNDDIESMTAQVRAILAELSQEDTEEDDAIKEEAKRRSMDKVEQLLYNYTKFKNSLEYKLKKLKTATGEEEKQQLYKAIVNTKLCVNMIEYALGRIKEEPFSVIIKLKYIEGKRPGEVAALLDLRPERLLRHTNKLLDLIRLHMFPDEYMMELLS